MSQETFIALPTWIESYFATLTRQQTMIDLFHLSTIVMDMCQRSSENGRRDRDYLHPLELFQKRIAIANAYNTDFLVSVSSAGFLSSESDSMHHQQSTDSPAFRLMRKSKHVALQVSTNSVSTENKTMGTAESLAADKSRSRCVNSLDQLGWHKIFMDTRSILPDCLQMSTPELIPRKSYSSKELHEHFKRYGTLLPVAHPLNMANSRTDTYR